MTYTVIRAGIMRVYALCDMVFASVRKWYTHTLRSNCVIPDVYHSATTIGSFCAVIARAAVMTCIGLKSGIMRVYALCDMVFASVQVWYKRHIYTIY
jgi:hypothetical protein